MKLLSQFRGMNKILSILLSLAVICCTICLVGCNCSNVDCASDAVFNFKLVDKASGADLIYEKGVSLDKFKLTLVSTSTQIPIEKFESNKSLFFTFTPSALDYKIEYQSQVILLTLKIMAIDNECCKEYEVTSISSNVEAFQDGDNKLFILKIDI